jgi:hypothetical protein
MHRSGASELEKGAGRKNSKHNALMEFIATKATQTLAQLARRRPFKIVAPSTTLHELARTMSSGSHIVGVRGDDSLPGGICRVITQGMLFKYLIPHLQVRLCCCTWRVHRREWVGGSMGREEERGEREKGSEVRRNCHAAG